MNPSAPNHGPHTSKDTSTASQWTDQFGDKRRESGCQKGKVYSNDREKLEHVPGPAIAPQKPPRTGHVSDFVYSGWSLRQDEGTDRLFSESQLLLLTIAGQM